MYAQALFATLSSYDAWENRKYYKGQKRQHHKVQRKLETPPSRIGSEDREWLPRIMNGRTHALKVPIPGSSGRSHQRIPDVVAAQHSVLNIKVSPAFRVGPADDSDETYRDQEHHDRSCSRQDPPPPSFLVHRAMIFGRRAEATAGFAFLRVPLVLNCAACEREWTAII